MRPSIPKLPAILSLLAAALGSCSVAPVVWPARVPAAEGAAPELRQAAEDALDRLHQAPADEAAIVWYGRRLGYLGLYHEAVDVYTRGLALHPGSPRLLRHRGHRFLSLRRFAAAQQDLEFARRRIVGTMDEVEADGLPNARGIPTSTLHTNIHYHLGLAHYFAGRFAEAGDAFAACRAAAGNRDMEVAARYWCFLCAHRVGDADGMRAAWQGVEPDWDILENHAYHRLLLLFAGAIQRDALLPDHADPLQNKTLAYGLARHRFLVGEEEQGWAELAKVAAGGGAAFGVIAAEADLAGRGRAGTDKAP